MKGLIFGLDKARAVIHQVLHTHTVCGGVTDEAVIILYQNVAFIQAEGTSVQKHTTGTFVGLYVQCLEA